MGNAVNQTVPTNCVDGRKRQVCCPPVILQEQYFDPTSKEIEAHYQWLSMFFHHENYIRIQNQPVMLLYYYNERALPIIEELRKLAIKDGFDGIYWIVGCSAAPDEIFVMNNPNLTNMMKRKTQTLDLFPLDDVFNQSMTYPYPLAWVDTYKILNGVIFKKRPHRVRIRK